MSALQQMRELLETALSKTSSRREERRIGQLICELQEAADFNEHHQLRGPVTCPPEFSLTPPPGERSAVPPITGGR